MKAILSHILHRNPPLDAPAGAWDADIPLIGLDEAMKEIEHEVIAKDQPLAADSAASFLNNTLKKLAHDDADLTAQIADLTARLTSVKLAHKAFRNALNTIEADTKAAEARMPQAVHVANFSGVQG